MITKMINAAIITACIPLTIFEFSLSSTKSNISFPIIPPNTEPAETSNTTFCFMGVLAFICLIDELMLMANTAQVDMKPTVSTLCIPMKSRSGFMMTPPPIPTIAPIVQAINIIALYKMVIIIISSVIYLQTQ